MKPLNRFLKNSPTNQRSSVKLRYFPPSSSDSTIVVDLPRRESVERWEACLVGHFLGVRFTSYHGNFMLRSTDLLALPAVDYDKAYAMQMGLKETLLTTQTVYFQVALLYPLADA
ncbi:unnamed protein product [Camellia sinensis]